MRATDRRRLRLGLIASFSLHCGVIGVFWVANRSAAEVPRMRVYSVDIVSPPPRELGEWSPAPAGEPEAAEAEPTPAEPAPAEPEPPAPQPVLAKEPSPPARATKKPAPPPKAAPEETTRPAPKELPKEASRAPAKETPKERGSGGTSDRSTGGRPDPTSPGGEGLDVRTEGARFVEPGYLENIVRQVNRYFRRPEGSRTDEAEIRFWIARDGSVSDIEVLRASGSFRFRAAAMEAVEQAGLRKSFGPLPKAYLADRLPVSFYFRPAR